MRLCYIANPHSIHVQRWLEYFAQRGYDVHLLSIYPDYPSLDGVNTHYTAALPAKYLNHMPLGRGWLSILFSIQRIRALVKKINPDIVHAHYAAPFGWLAAVAEFHPLVITLWGGDILAEQGAFKFPYNHLTPWALQKADLVTGVSTYLLELAKSYLRPSTDSQVIRIGVDIERFSPEGEGYLHREEHFAPIILSPRPFEPVYNIETIISAIPLVLTRIPEARFVFKDHVRTRQDRYRTAMLTRIAKGGFGNAVQYMGEIPYSAMPALYRSADVVVSVALSDGLPVSVLEAMACGIPLVVSDLPQFREFVVNEANALVVSPQNSEQLANAIIRVLTDVTLRTHLRAANLELVRTQGNLETEMARMEALYEKM